MLFFAIALAGCAADLATKHWVFQWRGLPRENNQWWVWEGYVGVETALNTGAVFGVGAGNSRLFAGLSITAVAAILAWLARGDALRDRRLVVALGCVTGGVLGNLYDRLGLWHGPDFPEMWRHAVRDWILFCVRDYYAWPNFNIADSLLVCGAALLMWQAFHSAAAGPRSSPSDA